MTGLQHSPHTLEKSQDFCVYALTLKSFETVFFFKNSQWTQPFCSEGSAVVKGSFHLCGKKPNN